MLSRKRIELNASTVFVVVVVANKFCFGCISYAVLCLLFVDLIFLRFFIFCFTIFFSLVSNNSQANQMGFETTLDCHKHYNYIIE